VSGRRQFRRAGNREISLGFANSTTRFSRRVESYRLHRPGYPPEIVDLLAKECGLAENSLVADIAAGTGLLTGIFLARGFEVIAIEPNREMRETCATLTAQFSRLRCIDRTAEATGLVDQSVDLITVGQAMHWFDLTRTRREFVRILKPGGWCAVLYNNRRMFGDRLHEGYEEILVEFGSDYEKVKHSHMTEETLAAFFAPNAMRSSRFENSQQLTLDGLMGRILSSSYMPQMGHSRFDEMSGSVAELFAAHESDGRVRMVYDCVVCYGQLS